MKHQTSLALFLSLILPLSQAGRIKVCAKYNDVSSGGLVNAIGVSVKCWDNDPAPNPDDFIGETTTDSTGCADFTFPDTDGGSSWDGIIGSDPDVFCKLNRGDLDEVRLFVER